MLQPCWFVGFFDNGKREYKTGVVGQANMAVTDPQSVANSPTSLRPGDNRPAPIVIQDANIAQPYSMRKTGAHCLDGRFLAGKAHREKADRLFADPKQFNFLLHQYPANKMFAKTIVDPLNTG